MDRQTDTHTGVCDHNTFRIVASSTTRVKCNEIVDIIP